MGVKISPKYLGIFLSALLATPGWGTSFIERPFSETVKDAPVVARGKIGNSSVEVSKGADGGKRIYTYYELQLEEVLKGQATGPTLMVRELGGEKEGVGMHVAGAAHFNRGEEVVLFLGPRNSDASHDVYGLMMGKLNIQRNESEDEILVGPSIGEGPEWTLEALRHLIQTQGDGAGKQKDPVFPSVSPTSKPEKRQESSASAVHSPAPPLQPSMEQEVEQYQHSEGLGKFAYLWGAGGVLGIWLIWMRRSRRTQR